MSKASGNGDGIPPATPSKLGRLFGRIHESHETPSTRKEKPPMTTTIDLDTLQLARGAHLAEGDCGQPPDMCLFEAYNWIIRQRHTDSCPPGVSPVLHAFGMRLNDRLPDAKRQLLKEFLPRPDGSSPLDGTADDGLDDQRAMMAANWALHTGARTRLAAAGLTDEAAALDAIPPITTRAELDAARPAIRDLRDRLWERRRTFYDDLRAQVRAKLAEHKPTAADAVAAAVAVAVAVAVADAVADAVAAAAAAAAADAAADAAAAAAAAADAVAAAAAAAAAAAVAAAAAAPWGTTYSQVYPKAKAAALEAIDTKHRPTIAAIEDSAIELFRAMIHPVPAAT